MVGADGHQHLLLHQGFGFAGEWMQFQGAFQTAQIGLYVPAQLIDRQNPLRDEIEAAEEIQNLVFFIRVLTGAYPTAHHHLKRANRSALCAPARWPSPALCGVSRDAGSGWAALSGRAPALTAVTCRAGIAALHRQTRKFQNGYPPSPPPHWASAAPPLAPGPAHWCFYVHTWLPNWVAWPNP